jgi:hypothetical protein
VIDFRYEVGGCEVVWAIKDHSIGHTFFDEGAAVFFLPHLVSTTTEAVGSEGLRGCEAAGGEGLRGCEAAGGGGLRGTKTATEDGELTEVSPLKRLRYALDKRPGASAKKEGWSKEMVGGALGPDWHSDLYMTGKAFDEVRQYFVVCFNHK